MCVCVHFSNALVACVTGVFVVSMCMCVHFENHTREFVLSCSLSFHMKSLLFCFVQIVAMNVSCRCINSLCV